MPCLAIILLANALVSSVSELTNALRRADTNATFALTATVTGVIADYQEIAIQDETGRCIVSKRPVCDIPLALGDTVRVRGRIAPSDRDDLIAHCDALTVIAQGPCEPPIDVSLRQFNAGACDIRRIRASGTVLEAFRDERDSDWIYLVLSDDSDAAKMKHFLSLASISLLSCRQELRNCLWDLRNLALDAPDMDEAVRQTLRPHLGDTRLFVRFNVSRDKLSDDAAYAALRIIRELVSNAIRHGRATEIRIADVALEGGRLMFSVRDNGGGFDPDCVPGSAQGHFGLQGIRERLRRLHGTLAIRSSASTGTKATVTLA